MTIDEAAKLLELPPDATPEQLEARFNEFRTKLEGKIAKAPTPGLKDKYRRSLDDITKAFETLVLAADASSLPVLQQVTSERSAELQLAFEKNNPELRAKAPHHGGDTPAPVKSTVKTGNNREFLLVALIAVTVLGAGGWWVMKTRAENAEQARITAQQARLAAEAKAEAERLAEEQRLAAEAEQRRREQQLTELRSRFAELNVGLDSLTRIESIADRELGDLRSRERDALNEAKGTLSPAIRKLSAKVRAQNLFVSWLRNQLASHPARVARARTEQLLQARSVDEATVALADYDSSLHHLRADIDTARREAVTVGTVRVESNLPGTEWTLTDAFGVELKGATPALAGDVALGRASLVFRRPRWPDVRREVEVTRGDEPEVRSDYNPAVLALEVEPADAVVTIADGRHLEASIWSLEPGRHVIEVEHRDFVAQLITLEASPGETLSRRVSLDHNYSKLLVPLIRERMKQVPPKDAVNLGIQAATWADADETRILIHDILALAPEKPETDHLFTMAAQIAIQLAQKGLKAEARALADWLDRMEDRGLLVLSDKSYSDGIGYRSDLARRAVVRIAAGDERGAQPYLDRMIASFQRHDAKSWPTPAHRTAAAVDMIARYLANHDCDAESRAWARRARATGVTVDKGLEADLLAMEARAAVKAGDLEGAVARFRQVASMRTLYGYYQTFGSAIRTARRLNRKDLEDAIVTMVQEFEAQGRFTKDPWDRPFYLKTVAAPDNYLENRMSFLRSRSRQLREARATPDALESLKQLSSLLQSYRAYYQPGDRAATTSL